MGNCESFFLPPLNSLFEQFVASLQKQEASLEKLGFKRLNLSWMPGCYLSYSAAERSQAPQRSP